MPDLALKIPKELSAPELPLLQPEEQEDAPEFTAEPLTTVFKEASHPGLPGATACRQLIPTPSPKALLYTPELPAVPKKSSTSDR